MSPGSSSHAIQTPDLIVQLDELGNIASLHHRGRTIQLSGTSALKNSHVLRHDVQKSGDSVIVTRLYQSAAGSQAVMKQFFRPAGDAIMWELEIIGVQNPWSVPIETELHYPISTDTKFWTPWADPAARGPVEVPGVEIGQGIPAMSRLHPWQDPLVPVSFRDQLYYYGAPFFNYDQPNIGYTPFRGDIFAIPLASVLELQADFGVSLLLSPGDDMLDMTMRTTRDGRITFSRLFQRICKERTAKFTMYLTAHEADWRGGLRCMTQIFPDYFYPSRPEVHELAGCGAYSSEPVEYDVKKMTAMGFKTNWRASFDFPYMGMFLPPVESDDTPWPRFATGKEPATISRRILNDYAETLNKDGFRVLSYFNVTEFGAHVKLPPAEEPDPQNWMNGNHILATTLRDAILPVSLKLRSHDLIDEVNNPWHAYYTWEGAIAMDPGEPCYQQFLLDQARMHIMHLPASSGLCIDRLDWLRIYNEKRDDGVSWFDEKPARSLNQSWCELMEKLGDVMHGAGKYIFCNNHTKRLDHLRRIDGLFDEFTYSGTSLNTVALLTLFKPALGWTGCADHMKPDPDAFFQRHLYMGVFPMAPFPGNDHSLQPDPWVDEQYLAYGPLLRSMQGRQWVLDPYAVKVTDGKASANIFRKKDSYVLPVVFGESHDVVSVSIASLDGLKSGSRIEIIHPHADATLTAKLRRNHDRWQLDVPLSRGCALVQITT